MRQSLLNLLSNAIKITEAGGTIEITGDGDVRNVRICVTEGTGLGLSIRCNLGGDGRRSRRRQHPGGELGASDRLSGRFRIGVAPRTVHRRTKLDAGRLYHSLPLEGCLSRLTRPAQPGPRIIL